MQKFIPVTKAIGQHINLDRLFSFEWAQIFGVIGARGYGKTFAFKRKCVKSFLYDKKKFIILRDTTASCEELEAQNGFKAFNDIFSIVPAFKGHTYGIENHSILIDGKYAGEIMPLSTYYKYKGNAYDAGWVLFDEFIEESVQAYRGNRARQFANTLETIIRDKKTRVGLTANALDSGNDILELLGIHIKSGQYGFYINKEKKVVIYYAPNSPEFEERKANSLSTIITQGSVLDASMNKNVFEAEGCEIFERRGPCSIFGIYYNNDNECFRLYQGTGGDIYYVCKDINANSCNYLRYVFNPKQAGKNRILLDNSARAFLKRLLQLGKVKFESQFIFGVFCSVVNNTMKKN